MLALSCTWGIVLANAGKPPTNVPSLSDAQHLHVQPPCSLDRFFIRSAKSTDISRGQCAVRYVDVLSWDVNVGKQVLMHEAHIGLEGIRLQGSIR